MRIGSFLLGIVAGVVIAVLVGVLGLPYLGLFDMTATGQPGLLDWWGGTNLHHMLEKRAPATKIPAGADPAQAIGHYTVVCRHCHGTPEAAGEDWAQRMLPRPPRLWEEDTQAMPDGQLFYVVSNGVRMTGMPAFGPAHSPEEIWNFIALLRRLDRLAEAPAPPPGDGQMEHPGGGERHQ